MLYVRCKMPVLKYTAGGSTSVEDVRSCSEYTEITLPNTPAFPMTICTSGVLSNARLLTENNFPPPP